MATLKYWKPDGDNGAWVSVGAPIDTEGYVPLTGGRMTGLLTIDTGEPHTTQLAVHGTHGSIWSTAYIGGTFDGNINLSTPRTVDFGGARVTKTGEPLRPDSATTKKYIDATFNATPRPNLISRTLKSLWDYSQEDLQLAGYRINNGNMVVLEGCLIFRKSITPGEQSPVILVLPENARPKHRHIFAVIGDNDIMYTITVGSDGGLRIITGPIIQADGYISLDSVRYPI